MSTSSEIVDSGNKMADKSNFSHTFNLLTQYLKENGSLGDLNLGMTSSNGSGSMNLFKNTVSNQQVVPRESAAQMTIFYGGQVIVLDDFPADKATEIMMLAGNGKGTFHSASDWIPNPTSTHKQGRIHLQPAVAVCDLPIARKASLARFLEKRKERITARAPYQSETNSSKDTKPEAWTANPVHHS